MKEQLLYLSKLLDFEASYMIINFLSCSFSNVVYTAGPLLGLSQGQPQGVPDHCDALHESPADLPWRWQELRGVAERCG